MKRIGTKARIAAPFARSALSTLAWLLCAGAALASNEHLPERPSRHPLTLAVYGDWPYGPELLGNAPRLIDSINADPNVRLVMHVGDIHSGSMPCTGAALSPLPATSVPDWNRGIFNLFNQFNDPVVYTPGDNEWTDCHKTKQGASGYPPFELAAVRQLFFARPGQTLGRHHRHVFSQAQFFSRAHPADAQFVENVMWQDARVVFVTLNVPGSNNDGLPWKGGSSTVPGNAPYSTTPFVPPYLNEAARTREVSERTDADLRWLRTAFLYARATGAKAVLVGLQADMWDPAAVATGGDGLDGYDTLVRELAAQSLQFHRPVLVINGDSHVYGADHPLADPTSATGRMHNTPAVPNLTRITVQGSTNHPSEWLRLGIDPESPAVFSWDNVAYLP